MDPNLDVIQAEVFDVTCATSSCHDAQTVAGELDLSSADASFAGLVEVPATNAIASENGWLRVAPGDPDRSFLVRKLELPGIGEGAPMPVGDLRVTASYMDLIATWIADGAER